MKSDKLKPNKSTGPVQNKIIAIAHQSDLDGIGSHAILHRYAKQNNVEIRHYFVDYLNFNQTIEEISGDPNPVNCEIIIADIGYNHEIKKSENILRNLSKNNSISWFDHHKWADDTGDNIKDILKKAVIDMKFCAAELVCREFLPADKISKKIAGLARIHDFRHDRRESSENELAWRLYEVIASGYDKEKLLKFLADGDFENDCIKQAYTSYQLRKSNAMKELDLHSKKYEIGNFSCTVGFSPDELSSTIASDHLIKGGSDLVICICESGKMSFRRNNKGIDLVKIAGEFDGGGREDAAGGFFCGDINEKNYSGIFDEIIKRIRV